MEGTLCKFSVRSHQPEQFQILVVPFLLRLFAKRISKDDERVLTCIHLCRERIPCHVCIFQHQRKELLRIAFHAFIANSYKSRVRSVLVIIIRCQNTSLDFHFKQGASFVFNRDKLYFRYRVKPCFYHFADKVGICLYVLQSYNFTFIVYAIEQAAAVRMAKAETDLSHDFTFLRSSISLKS